MGGRDRRGRDYYLSLKCKIMLLVIIVSFTPLVVISGTVLYQFRASYQEKVLAHLQEVVKKHVQNIDSFLDERLADFSAQRARYAKIKITLKRAPSPRGGREGRGHGDRDKGNLRLRQKWRILFSAAAIVRPIGCAPPSARTDGNGIGERTH